MLWSMSVEYVSGVCQGRLCVTLLVVMVKAVDKLVGCQCSRLGCAVCTGDVLLVACRCVIQDVQGCLGCRAL